MNNPNWQIECDRAVFESLKGEVIFRQILALARSVNSLQFVFDAFVADGQDTSSKAKRSRIIRFCLALRFSTRVCCWWRR
jgi:hypothetical protein